MHTQKQGSNGLTKSIVERLAAGEREISRKIMNKLESKQIPIGSINEWRYDNARHCLEYGTQESQALRRLRRIFWRTGGVLGICGALAFPVRYIKDEVHSISSSTKTTQVQK